MTRNQVIQIPDQPYEDAGSHVKKASSPRPPGLVERKAVSGAVPNESWIIPDVIG